MKPLRLRLENFLSHADTTIDFEDVTAAVLLGDNGAGKSSVLDAIPWALYGEGRAETADGFIRWGASSARVTFEFEFEFEFSGVVYRVVRERSSASRGRSSLSLSVMDWYGPDADEPPTPVQGGHIAEVQAAIDELLGMDLRCFLDTSFVGQGSLSSRFTDLGPADRKRLIYDILRVDVYKRAAEAARQQSKALATEIAGLNERAGELDAELAREQDAREIAAANAAARDQAAQRSDDLAAKVETARADLDSARSTVAQLESARAHVAAERARLTGDVRAIGDDLMRLAHDLDTAEAERRRAEETLATLRAASAASSSIEGEAMNARFAADEARNEAEAQMREAAEADAKAAGETAQAAAAQARIPETARHLEELVGVSDPACPVCRSDLDDRRRDQLIAEYRGAIQEAQTSATEHRNAARQHKTEADARRLRAREHSHRAATLTDRANELRLASDRAVAAGERIPEEQARLEALVASIADITERRRNAVERQNTAAAILDTFDHSAIEDGAALNQAQEYAARAASAVDAASREQADAQRRLLEVTAAAARSDQVLAELARVREQRERVRADLEAREEPFWQLATIADGMPRALAVYVEAFAIPAIEEEANRLLERLWGGEMVLRLESQKATKAGDIRETLDIVVVAGSEERTLSALSGGERQAIDIACAIGLAKVLAHRADRPIECLVIDEGFTAMDAGHRQTVLRLLRDLQEDIPVLLAVSHDPAFADAFPTRIHVSKDAAGSHVEVTAA